MRTMPRTGGGESELSPAIDDESELEDIEQC